MSEAVVDAHGLTRRFGRFTAVDDLELHVAAGEVFGLLGANGAGKTTAIRMLCGLLSPSAGNIRVAGIDMVRHPLRGRARIGYLAQGFALYEDLSVRENLGLQAGLYGLTGRRRRERIDWALDHLELGARADAPARDLPHGYRRRLSLAAALLHEPGALFLDEPTSGVDPAARQRFWELIYELAEAGVGVLVTTHYMDEAAFCDRLTLMEAGRVVERGSPGELAGRPLATPLVQVRAGDRRAAAGFLRDHPEVVEVVPHAGHLRLRLAAGSDVEGFTARLPDEAAAEGLQISTPEPATPELEDVFVSVLEEAAE